MNGEREGWHKQHTADELTERQREVVRLIVDGKTNSEIASELGITLDGAKYHVREVCTRIGVDSREEVAEWWRQQRGMRARFAVTARWSRMPALVKWGLGGVAAAAVVVVAVFALLLATGSDDGDRRLSPGVWVVVAEYVDLDRITAHSQLVAVSLDETQRREIGHVAAWHSTALAHSGDRLVALQSDIDGDDLDLQLWWFDIASGESFSTDFAGQVGLNPDEGMFASRYAWSPDSTRVLAFEGWVTMLDRQGNVVGDTVLHRTFPENPPWSRQAHSMRVTWASDSSFVLASNRLSLNLISRDGELLHSMEAAEFVDISLDEGQNLRIEYLVPLESGAEISLQVDFDQGVDRPAGYDPQWTVEVTIENGRIVAGEARPFDFDEVPDGIVDSFITQETLDELFAGETYAPGPGGSSRKDMQTVRRFYSRPDHEPPFGPTDIPADADVWLVFLWDGVAHRIRLMEDVSPQSVWAIRTFAWDTVRVR